MRELTWTRGAEIDLQSLFQDEEHIREGAGAEFYELVDAALNLLKAFPEMAPVYKGRLRRLRLRNRRHGVFYTLEPRRIVIQAIADLRRDPDRLKERFREIG